MKQRQMDRLKRLHKRLTEPQQVRRLERMSHRAEVSKEHAITRGILMGVVQVMRRGFVGRMRWLFLGR